MDCSNCTYHRLIENAITLIDHCHRHQLPTWRQHQLDDEMAWLAVNTIYCYDCCIQ